MQSVIHFQLTICFDLYCSILQNVFIPTVSQVPGTNENLGWGLKATRQEDSLRSKWFSNFLQLLFLLKAAVMLFPL